MYVPLVLLNFLYVKYMCLSKIKIESILFQFIINSLHLVFTCRKSWFCCTFFLFWWWSNHPLIHIWLEDDIVVILCNRGLSSWFCISFNISIGTIIFLGLMCWLFPQTKSQYCETTSIEFSFSIMSCVVSWTFSNSFEKWDTYSFANGPHL
jgi:hypothetical protein